ncbi:hypothetical protein AB3S75_027273 [Citrus x aurantiifolia]
MSMEDYMEGDYPGASVSIFFSGNEIPNWFSGKSDGSSVTIELPPQWCSSDDGWPLLNCKVKKCGVCLLLSEEEDRESGDSFNEESGDGFNEIECIGSRSNGGHSEEEDDRNTRRLKENEPKIDARTLWLGQGRVNLITKIFLVGLALIFFWWCFLGIASTNGFFRFLPI